jgi:hypothetical protein
MGIYLVDCSQKRGKGSQRRGANVIKKEGK